MPVMPQEFQFSYPSSTYFLQRDKNLINWRKNKDIKNYYQIYGQNRNNDYIHEINSLTAHDNSPNQSYRRWYYRHADHSYHQSYDSGTPHYEPTDNWQTSHRKAIWPNTVPTLSLPVERPLLLESKEKRLKKHNTSYMTRDGNKPLFNSLEKYVKNDKVFKQMQISWNLKENNSFKHHFYDIKIK